MTIHQRHRDAAASREPNGRERDQILRGKRDKSANVQAFVKFEADHMTPGFAAGVEAGVLNPETIFDLGYCWQAMLRGQVLEDSRAVGRTLYCDLFEPIAPHIAAVINEVGFNSFESADFGIVAAKRIIKAALLRALLPTASDQEGAGE